MIEEQSILIKEEHKEIHHVTPSQLLTSTREWQVSIDDIEELPCSSSYSTHSSSTQVLIMGDFSLLNEKRIVECFHRDCRWLQTMKSVHLKIAHLPRDETSYKIAIQLQSVATSYQFPVVLVEEHTWCTNVRTLILFQTQNTTHPFLSKVWHAATNGGVPIVIHLLS